VREVAVIGTGIIGSCVARRQAAAGRKVAVWNRTRAKAEALAGGRIVVADTPRRPGAGPMRSPLSSPTTRFSPCGALASAVKDLALTREAGTAAGLLLPCAEGVCGVFAAAAAEGADEDIAAVYRHIAQREPSVG
jgi:3-hydroxyisobutyrate dehydrogenase-like beta-hydroxyacid dehydrogenase